MCGRWLKDYIRSCTVFIAVLLNFKLYLHSLTISNSMNQCIDISENFLLESFHHVKSKIA